MNPFYRIGFVKMYAHRFRLRTLHTEGEFAAREGAVYIEIELHAASGKCRACAADHLPTGRPCAIFS